MMDPRDPDEIEDDFAQEGDEGTNAGQIDDESGGEAARQDDEVDQAEERVDRRQRRDDTLREEIRAEREHRARVEAELNILRQEREQRQQPQGETEEQFQARIALLDPESRIDAKVDRALRRSAQQTALATFASADRADKMTYDANAAVNPLYKKHAAAVEATMVEARRRGMDINRETALNLVIGNSVRQNQGKVSPARQQAQQRVASQQSRTTGGQGDQRREGRPRRYAQDDMSPEAVRQRLSAPDAFI